jgi:hypothetical protein
MASRPAARRPRQSAAAKAAGVKDAQAAIRNSDALLTRPASDELPIFQETRAAIARGDLLSERGGAA